MGTRAREIERDEKSSALQAMREADPEGDLLPERWTTESEEILGELLPIHWTNSSVI